jgi:hypothetical protein
MCGLPGLSNTAGNPLPRPIGIDAEQLPTSMQTAGLLPTYRIGQRRGVPNIITLLQKLASVNSGVPLATTSLL